MRGAACGTGQGQRHLQRAQDGADAGDGEPLPARQAVQGAPQVTPPPLRAPHLALAFPHRCRCLGVPASRPPCSTMRGSRAACVYRRKGASGCTNDLPTRCGGQGAAGEISDAEVAGMRHAAGKAASERLAAGWRGMWQRQRQAPHLLVASCHACAFAGPS